MMVSLAPQRQEKAEGAVSRSVKNGEIIGFVENLVSIGIFVTILIGYHTLGVTVVTEGQDRLEKIFYQIFSRCDEGTRENGRQTIFEFVPAAGAEALPKFPKAS